MSKRKNRRNRNDRDRIKSNLSEFELFFKLFVIEKSINAHISRLESTVLDCTKSSDKQLFGECLRKARYAKLHLNEAFDFFNEHGFLYLSTIDGLVKVFDEFNEDLYQVRKRSLEILIEMGEEIDFEIPKDLKLEEN